jgi:hypothetical protein
LLDEAVGLDSKAVNLAIRAEIRPLVSEAGFHRSTARTFWRHHSDRVDVINFQSFNSYNAGVLGITTFSFALNLGCYLRYIPNRFPSTPDSDRLAGDNIKPKEYECPLRGRLRRSYLDKACRDTQIWYIDPHGSNLGKALHDARVVLNRDGIPWFEQFTSPRSVYDILATRDEQAGALWGFGRPGSPIRTYFAGYAAKACGLYEEAEANLNHAAATKSFEGIKERILSDARRAV